MAITNRSHVFLDVSIGQEPAGRLTIELFVDKAPKTCKNFRQLCTAEHNGLSYAMSPFHRVIDEFMVQGGDITNGDGTGGDSIYGAEFEDENLGWRDMDAAGLVCSANRGKDTNGSQFFITLEPCPHLNGKHTIFGHLVSGHETLQRIAKVDADKNDKPLEPVLVAKCGELERKNKGVPRQAGTVTEDSRDRGRRRTSEVPDEASPPPARPGTGRRESDRVVDEGLRGRPRARSGDRASKTSMSSSEDMDGSRSPVKKHKRKRSVSPSRHQNGNELSRSPGFGRRRRSLPNQYGEERYKDRYGDTRQNKHIDSPASDASRRSWRRDDDGYRGRRDGDDSYRPSRERYQGDRGDLGRSSRSDGRRVGAADGEAPVRFKGRGIMKYRESGRL